MTVQIDKLSEEPIASFLLQSNNTQAMPADIASKQKAKNILHSHY